MEKKALIILADGFEEIEAVTCIDILRRAGIKVVIAGLTDTQVTGSRNIIIKSQTLLQEAGTDFDALILPGGMPGAENLASSDTVKSLIKTFSNSNKLIAAICAAPVIVLAPLGILKNKNATCYPGMQNKTGSLMQYSEERVVVDRNLITSQGPGTALEFALKVTEKLAGKKISEKVKKAALAI